MEKFIINNNHKSYKNNLATYKKERILTYNSCNQYILITIKIVAFIITEEYIDIGTFGSMIKNTLLQIFGGIQIMIATR